MRRSLRTFAARVDTEAVVQEALLRAWQFAPRCGRDGKTDGLLRFCLRAARNLAVSELRRQRMPQLELDELERRAEADPVAWAPPDPLLRARIVECRDRLPRQPGRALAARLLCQGGVADRDLAERLGMRLNTFLQNITRARKLLADCLRRLGIDLDLERP